MTLEENLITGLNKERKGMIDCEQPTHIHMPGLPLTESGPLADRFVPLSLSVLT